ncbi:MAG: tetratricopeptide repeat protein [Ruminococcaceae bacterium]|nr:tetratricopeptide repeat protein [Oscillospiraceae bacterium]
MNNKLNADEFSAQINALLDEGDHAQALSLCASLELPEDDADMKVTILMMRAFSHMAAGDTDQAVSNQLAAFSAADELPAVEQLGIAEGALKVQMPFDFCAELFTRSAERFEREGEDCAMAAGAFNKAGICLFRHGASTAAEKHCFYRALKCMDSVEDDALSKEHRDVLKALIQSNLAECLSREGEPGQAMELYEEAADVFGKYLGNEDNMCLTHYAICQRCLSDIYRHSDENIRAHTCLSRSITELERRRKKLSDQLKLHLAVCYNARGTLRFQMGDYEGEVDDCTRSLQLREDLDDDPNAKATVISNRAEAYSMLKQYDAARDDFLRAIDILDAIPESISAAVSAATRSYSLGLLYFEQNMHEQSCGPLRSAADRLAIIRSRATDDMEYTYDQLTDIEALARMRLSASLYQCRERDYFDTMTEAREAIRLTELLPLTAERAARLAALHLSLSELLEILDEHEAARDEYEIAEDFRDEGIALALSELGPDDGEESIYEDFDDESGIWEDFSDNTPQG